MPTIMTYRAEQESGVIASRGLLAMTPPGAGGCAQAAGPLASVTVVVCDWPDVSVQPMLILSPGW